MTGNKMICNNCGGLMRIAPENLKVVGQASGTEAIVALRCDKCNITRFEARSDIEEEMGAFSKEEISKMGVFSKGEIALSVIGFMFFISSMIMAGMSYEWWSSSLITGYIGLAFIFFPVDHILKNNHVHKGVIFGLEVFLLACPGLLSAIISLGTALSH